MLFVVFRDRFFAVHHSHSCRTSSLWDQSHHRCVVCKLNGGVAGVGGSAVSGVERAEQWAQHTVLWGAHVQCLSGGEVGAQFDCLGSVCEEVCNPGAGAWGSQTVC